jgi:hypothetical protein
MSVALTPRQRNREYGQASAIIIAPATSS